MISIEIIKFTIYCLAIIVISKYMLAVLLRKIAENMKLKVRTIGNLAGVTTSIPELLTICISSFNGLMIASIYNVLSSNIINLIQYIATIYINKNQKYMKNIAIRVDIFIVFLTIIIPILFISFKVEMNVGIILGFIALYIFLKHINKNSHNVFLKKEEKSIDQEIEEEIKNYRKHSKTILYFFLLFISGILLFIVGDMLGDTINKLCRTFNVPEVIIGIILGGITSLPELITFFESQKHHKNDNNEILGVVEATNNLLTSNMFNLFIIQSLGILIFRFL